MALDPEKKEEIVEHLLVFSRNKEFYERAGKAWKRGYFLYGPPGTGKSTMIAAMANLLSYDVYDLELTAVEDNTELRKLLIETTSKSIIVIEDIDCSLDLTGQRKKKGEKFSKEDKNNDNDEFSNKEMEEAKEEGNNGNNSSNKVTLSGILNFIDGLWSACGGERLIVFTTNYVEKLDPALIAKNYLGIESHQMFDKIKNLIGEVKITPADVAENLMPKSPMDDPERCLSNLIRALEEAKEETAAVEGAAEEAKRSAEDENEIEKPEGSN
ncbi:putative mitochondrial chaperone BCS1-B [Morus notabilis]|uniref:Putative mitochondrial chaperone BCS1-B n=1 Tax=Morus notabilis TaxID=981085 RepID=W9QNT3_9ROSA|nr:putative mitochondrial chaperone BCS1-B [Morus notabilis]